MSDGRARGPATVRALTFPLRLRCTGAAELLAAEGLEEAVARALGRAFDRARQTLPASVVVLHPPELVRGEFPPDEQSALLGRLSRAVEQAARARSLPTAPAGSGLLQGPAGRAAAEPWRVEAAVEFPLTPRQFFGIRQRHAAQEGGSTDPADPLELYFPLLDEPVPATAWVTGVLDEREVGTHSREVLGRFAATRRPDEYVWSVHGWDGLRAMLVAAAPEVADGIPEFSARGFVGERAGSAEGERRQVLRPGAWTLSVFLPLPGVVLADLVELGKVDTVDVPLREAAALGTAADFAAEAGLDLPAAVRDVPDVPVAVAVTPFTVRCRIHERALAALFVQYRREQFGGGRLGAVVPLTQSATAGLGPALRSFLAARATSGGAPAGGFWPPGGTGVNLTPLVGDVRKQVLRTANADFIRAEAAEAERILRTENGVWSADRDDALRGFLTRWTTKVRDGELFGLLLDELERRGDLDAFVRAVRGLPTLDTPLKRDVVALADRDPRIAAVARDVESLVLDIGKHHYDVDAQEILIGRDPGRTLRAAGRSGDDRAGVVAVVEPYYAESSRILQPKPEILDRLREPTRKKVSELIGRMVCRPGEQMTREELLHRATQEAARELPPLEEKDLVKVTLVKSVRVLRLERRRERGIDEVYVHYQPVQKVGDNPWMPAGDVRVQVPAAFEAYLTTYHVQHLESALTVVMMGEAVVLGGVMIVELGVATVGQLFFFVSMQVVVYHFTTDAEDRTLEGYLGAALKGELDAVGFKGLSGAVRKLGGFAAGQLVTRELVGQVAAKWIVYGLRGVATATGVGGLEATYQFGDDLVHYSHCNGWSNPGKYWDRFTTGFAMTLAFEFLAVPVLSPPLRLALEKATTATQAARALRASGKPLREIAGLLLRGAEGVEASVGRTVGNEAGPAIARGFRQKVGDVLKALGREYESRAAESLLEAYAPEPGGEAPGRLPEARPEPQPEAQPEARPEAQPEAAPESAEGGTPGQAPEEAPPAEPKAPPAPAPPRERLDDVLRRLADRGFTKEDVLLFKGPRKRLSVEVARRVEQLLEKYAPEEVRALGRRLALRKVYLSKKMVAQILEHMPRGRLGAAIAEKELPVEDEAVPQVVSKEDIADLSVREKEPPRTRYGPGELEKPLRDVVETPGSRALRKSLVARDGEEPPDGYHAHHIVPEKDFSPGLDWLRNRLAEAGCGINEAGNGVFLAGSRYTANPELTRLHLSYIHAGKSKEYAYTLTFRLGRLRGGALLREVEAIGEEMRCGEFKIMEIPYGWKGKWEPGMAVPSGRKAAPGRIEE
ncbi:AHH domain-containing protein [Streptomyces griseoincarnatus]